MLVTAHFAWYRQGSTTSDAAGDALASKEPSAFLNHHKLKTSQSERELPALIPSHTPEGGRIAAFLSSCLTLLCNLTPRLVSGACTQLICTL